jgi:predicted transcriptional regulator
MTEVILFFIITLYLPCLVYHLLMNSLEEILVEINSLCSVIKTKYPELYHFLDERPITIASTRYPDVSEKMLKNYLENLQELLKTYGKTHGSDQTQTPWK